MRDICDSEVSPVVPGDGLFLSGGGLCVRKRRRFTRRPLITHLNAVKMETSSGHTLPCQPHFPPLDRAAIPPFFPPSTIPATPTSRPCQLSLWRGATSLPPPPPTSVASFLLRHTPIRPLSAAPRADLRFNLMGRYVKQT